MFVYRHKNQLQFRPDLITSPCASSILPPPPSAPQNVCGEMKQTPLRLLQLFYYYYYYFHMNLFWVFLLFIFFIQVSLISMSPIPCVLWKKSNWVTRDGFFFWRWERKELMSDCNSRVKPCMLVMCGIVFGLLFPFLFFSLLLVFVNLCMMIVLHHDCICSALVTFWDLFVRKKKRKKKKVWTSASIRHFPLIKPRPSIILFTSFFWSLVRRKKKDIVGWKNKKRCAQYWFVLTDSNAIEVSIIGIFSRDNISWLNRLSRSTSGAEDI